MLCSAQSTKRPRTNRRTCCWRSRRPRTLFRTAQITPRRILTPPRSRRWVAVSRTTTFSRTCASTLLFRCSGFFRRKRKSQYKKENRIMADPFVAEIRIFPFNFAPKGWAFCDGQLMPLSQNTALFSLLGTTYGGDGKSTFALPNMEGSAPIHAGQGPGLSLYDLGQTGGSDAVTLLESEIPSHS